MINIKMTITTEEFILFYGEQLMNMVGMFETEVTYE
jgi:hypothetical protein